VVVVISDIKSPLKPIYLDYRDEFYEITVLSNKKAFLYISSMTKQFLRHDNV
jgi:hypothetical protein